MLGTPGIRYSSNSVLTLFKKSCGEKNQFEMPDHHLEFPISSSPI